MTAVIDAGGLMEGATNLQVAEFALVRMPNDILGAAYFEKKSDSWCIVDRKVGM